MKPLIFYFVLPVLILSSCGGAETKADHSGIAVDTISEVPASKTPDEPRKDSPKEAAPRVSEEKPAESNEILAKIDSHLVSTSQFTAAPAGGISNCIVTITNNLPGVSFQKIIAEVSIKKDDGTEVRTDYYTVINLDPGTSKVIKIPNTTQGTKVVSHVVKVKSNELTKGESVLSGIHYVAN